MLASCHSSTCSDLLRLQLYGQFLASDGGAVRYDSLAASPDFEEYIRLAGEAKSALPNSTINPPVLVLVAQILVASTQILLASTATHDDSMRTTLRRGPRGHFVNYKIIMMFNDFKSDCK
jgi:hypothetical protein